MKFNIKSRKGFTLIELLVVIGILAVLAAIAIPSVAGLIDRANVSADKTNANEMTNAMERFASEYELFCQDIASGTFDKDNMDAAQGRVYNVLGIEDRAGIELVEIDADEPVDDDDIAIYRDTKYPANAKTAQLIVQNYTKTSSSTFEPKQSDMHYWYSPDCGVIVYAEPNAGLTPENIVNKLNAQVVSNMDAKGNPLDENTEWIDLTSETFSNTATSQKEFTTLTKKTWQGLTYFSASYMWKHNGKIYYSEQSNQYVLNGDTWEPVSWQGLTSFYGTGVWSDGNNTYYSWGSKSYILNGDTWTRVTWEGLQEIDGSYVWTDGKEIYYSKSYDHYVLKGNKWEEKTWKGLNSFYGGGDLWSDGTNFYYSNGTNKNYVLNGDTWEEYTWNISGFDGRYIWSDGTNYYLSGNGDSYVLHGNTWEEKTWNGCELTDGRGVWTDGENYYWSSGNAQYQLS